MSGRIFSKEMKQEEKQQKFHEALLKMLYPPPPPQAEEDEQGKLKDPTDSSYCLPGELENDTRNSSSSSSDEENGKKSGSEKLTRSQRKRLRKRKFKEAASRRRGVIGPLLPNSTDVGNDGGAGCAGETLQPVRVNAASGSNFVTNNSGPPDFRMKKNKIKQRRRTKKLCS